MRWSGPYSLPRLRGRAREVARHRLAERPSPATRPFGQSAFREAESKAPNAPPLFVSSNFWLGQLEPEFERLAYPE